MERLCYDTLEGLGCPPGDTVTIAGGAVKAPVWSQIRADILGKRLVQPAMVEASYGTAVIAGTVSLGRNLCEAAELMVKHTRVFEPDVGDMQLTTIYMRNLRYLQKEELYR